jgi:hypothetical protein
MLELLAVVAADPMAWPLWLVVTFAVGMYPVGFMFGTCSACCCSNSSCSGFDLNEAYSTDRMPGSKSYCNLTIAQGATSFQIPNWAADVHKGCKIVGPGIGPLTFITNVDRDEQTRVATITFSPAAISQVSGCLTFCGSGGLCVDDANRFGLFGQNAVGGFVGDDPLDQAMSSCSQNRPAKLNNCGDFDRTLSCIRWVCRCYESTGERSLDNPDRSQWYRVISTAVVGGPTTNGKNLGNELDDAVVNIDGEELSLQDLQLASSDITLGPDGFGGCLIWVFMFYGWKAACDYNVYGKFFQHEPADDCFTITQCVRCR